MWAPLKKLIPKKAKTEDGEVTTFWGNHLLALLLIITILIAAVFTVVSLTIYNKSGAAQLDLSLDRPGYKENQKKVDTDDSVKEYSATGAVNKATIEEFLRQYDGEAKDVKAVDAFNGDPLNPEVLGY